MKVLPDLQRWVEDLHDVEIDLEVGAYIVDDAVRAAIPGARPEIPEQLFVCEGDEVVEMALYIDPRVLRRLERDHPAHRLHQGNLESFCIALEGVSHFVLVAWRTAVRRPVSALELELQAEVDKFIVAWSLLQAQGLPFALTCTPLLNALFFRFQLHEGLEREEVRRYTIANAAAWRFCRDLTRRFARDTTPRRIHRAAREFVRLGLADKLL